MVFLKKSQFLGPFLRVFSWSNLHFLFGIWQISARSFICRRENGLLTTRTLSKTALKIAIFQLFAFLNFFCKNPKNVKILKKSPKKSAFFGRFYGFIDDFHNENRPKSGLSGPVKSSIFWIFLDFDQFFCDFLSKMADFEGRF